MKAYKGFNKDMTSHNGFQYEIGNTYETDEAKCCEKGFHACESPIDCFRYYEPNSSVYCEVELDGKFSRNGAHSGADSKVAATKITILSHINIGDMIQQQINYILDKIKKKSINKSAFSGVSGVTAHSSGNIGNKAMAVSAATNSTAAASGRCSQSTVTRSQSTAASSGDYCLSVSAADRNTAASSGTGALSISDGIYSTAAASGGGSIAASLIGFSTAVASGIKSVALVHGSCSIAAASGQQATAITENENSIAVASGDHSRAKGVIGSYIVLTEYDGRKLVCAKCVKITGKKYKPDTWYMLKEGKVIPWSYDQYQ